MKKYRCNCDAEFNSIKAMTAHYRKEHPDDGYSCWDQIGDLGDAFANKAMQHLWDKYRAARDFEAKYDCLARQFNELASKLNTIKQIINAPAS